MLVDPYAGIARALKPQHVLDLVRITPPAEQPLTRDEIVAHLRAGAGVDADSLLDDLITAATDYLDGYAGVLGRCLIAQTWKWSLDHRFPCRRIELPLPPLRSVTEIAYVDADGVGQILDPALYIVLDGPRSTIEPAPGTCWPQTSCRPRAVTITFVAGLAADAAGLPAPIKAALKLMVGDLYTNREAVVIDASRVTMIENPTAERLLAPFIARR